MAHWEDEDEENIACVSDPSWIAASKPVLAFLTHTEARSWPAIDLWAKEQRLNATVLRHCVAWLEEKGLARSFIRDGRTFWVSVSH